MNDTEEKNQQHQVIPAAIFGIVIGLIMAVGIAGYLERETLADIYFYLTADSVAFDVSGEIRQ
ncbi:hypothetical protein [Nitrosococcus watsonii]|uniref:Uncharacterized protein n=1 Tax=Nitrosococcus watsoni (strain C-113) TaxID=105559 RepID=D8KCG0_NITWC|nr:hypothetical protein [Nitrosococcus watsonii]ADJ29901.1 conserved hypothetical protein [Nitrosococcus watsonii C-113]